MSATSNETHADDATTDDLDERVEALVRKKVEEEEQAETDEHGEDEAAHTENEASFELDQDHEDPGHGGEEREREQAHAPEPTGPETAPAHRYPKPSDARDATPAADPSSTPDASQPTSRPSADTALADAIAQIWAKSRESAMARVTVVERAARELMKGPLDPELRERAQRQAHRLAGSLGTFGFPFASSLARELEHLFERTGPLEADEIVRACDMADQLRAELERPPQRDDAGPQPTASAGTIVIISHDGTLVGRIHTRLQAWGFAPHAFPALDRARAALGRQPAVVLLDLGPDTGAGQAAAMLRDFRGAAPAAPLVVLAPQTDTAMRTEVARANARRLIDRGAAPELIVEAVRSTAPPGRSGIPKVLLVGDAQRAAIRDTFPPERLQVAATTNTDRFLHQLERDPPAVVVIDASHPDVDAELFGHLLRMEPRWQQMPLVLLVSGAATDAYRLAAHIEADDVMPVPVSADAYERLIMAVDRPRSGRGSIGTGAGGQGTDKQRTIEDILDKAHRNDRHVVIVRLASGAPVADAQSHHDANRRLAKRLSSSLGTGDLATHDADGIVLALYDAEIDAAANWLDAALRTTLQEWTSPPDIDPRAGLAVFPDEGTEPATLLQVARDRVPTTSLQTRIGKATTQRAARAGGRILDILLIDDDETLGTLLTHALSARGYRIEWLVDGMDAANKLLGDPPALRPRLILLDVNLPSLDGLSLLRRFHDAGYLAHTKVIMLTARVREGEVVEALNLGAADHVGKPFSVPVLIERIRRVLGE